MEWIDEADGVFRGGGVKVPAPPEPQLVGATA